MISPAQVHFLLMNDEYWHSLGDGELVFKTLAHEDRSFEELVRRYKQRVLGLVFRFARDSHEAEDMAQETFVKAYFALSNFKASGSFVGWLLKIASRVSIDQLRKRKRKREFFFSEIADGADEDFKLDQIPGLQTRESEQTIHLTDLEEFYLKLLNRFSPEDQFILQAAELEGHSMREISEMTGKSVSAVKVRLLRARNKLRKYLEEIHGTP